jgi:hypothetical protein
MTYIESSKYTGAGGIPTAETSYKHDAHYRAHPQQIQAYQNNLSRVSSTNQIIPKANDHLQTITTDQKGKRGQGSVQKHNDIDEQLNYSYSKGVPMNKQKGAQISAYGDQGKV